jgi:hypothetical protein
MSVLVCRTLYLTSIAFNTTSQISLELSTPPLGSSDDGLAVCFMGANYELNPSTVSLVNATAGGDQFSIAVNPKAVSIDSIEYTSFWDIVKNDTFYQDPESLRCVPVRTGLAALPNQFTLPPACAQHVADDATNVIYITDRFVTTRRAVYGTESAGNLAGNPEANSGNRAGPET